MRKIKRFVLGVVVIVVGCSFFFMDFGALTSETSVNSNTGRFALSESAGIEKGINVSGVTYLYVEGGEEFDGVLGAELEEELDEELEEELYRISSRVMKVAKLKDKFDGQLVAVAVIWEDIDYTPLYSQSEMEILFFFSSSGESEYFEKFRNEKFGGKKVVVRFNSSQGHQVIKKGEINLKDTSYGVFSLKYYKRHLAERIADRIASKVGDFGG